MRAFLRGRASQVLLWGALIVTAVSSRGSVLVEAQGPALRWDGLIELISGRNEAPPPSLNPPIPADGPSQMSRHAVSGDGRYVVFTANAPSLGGYYGPALYLRDRRLSDTRMLFGGGSGDVRDAVISADGRHIAFTVCEPWMRPDQMPICDVWVMDTLTGSWSPLSVEPHQGEFGNADSDEPVLSSNGRFVVFRTAATNLVQGVPAGVPQLVIRDRDPDQNGVFDEPGPSTFEIVSAPDGHSGFVPGNGPSATAEVSDNGRYVAFRSAASNLVPGDTNAVWDVFRRDRQGRKTRRLNVRPYPSGSDESPDAIDSPAISMTPDGRYVAFASADPMLVPAPVDDINTERDVFVFDVQFGNLQRVDVGWLPYAPGTPVPGNAATEWPTLTADGRYVSLQSAAMNVERPPVQHMAQSYVVDRFTNTVTRVSIKPDGAEPSHPAIRPEISADGSLVAFVSQAYNLAPGVQTDSDRVYVAVHFEITPEEQTVPGGAGGAATYDVVTQQHTPWVIDWATSWQPWIDFETPPWGSGSGMLKVRANQANPDPAPRTATIKVFEETVRFTQLAGLSLTAISPAVGPETGGTQVTFTGTGFEPGMRVMFDGLDAVTTEFVSSTTLIATTPAHAPGTVWVGIMGAPGDYRNAWLDAAFRYADTTPPQLWYGFSDVPNEDGWFNRDVTLYWAWYDPETDVTTTSGCETTVIGVDTPGTTYTCTATSDGGSASLSAFVKRDATAPTATITSPKFTLHELGEVVEPAFTCSDALSGVASCDGATSGQPIDTSTPGYHTFGVSITDRAGNPAYVTVDYAVGSGVCAYPLPDMVSWWRMEGDTSNTRIGVATPATRAGLTSDVFVDAVVGQGYQFEGANGYLLTNYAPAIFSDRKLAVAAWVKPSANTLGTIMRVRDLFGVARLATGTIGWTFKRWNESTMSYRDTGVPLPLGQWSHVAVVLDGWAVRTYLNGRLAHTEPNVGDVVNPTNNYPVTIGGAQNVGDYFKGVLDELQIFRYGLSDAQIEQLFLAGNAGACVPKRTSFQIVEPIPASFGSPTYAFGVRLVDGDGQPVPGRTVQLMSQVGAWPYSTSTANRVTDADGRAHWDAPLKNAPRDLYEGFASATFTGDVDYVRTSIGPDVLVGKGNPVITWPAPAPITYSFPVNSTQLNATANVPGTFSYSVPSGTLLPAGTNTLTATFTPSDTANYNTVTATNTLTVNKATANVLIEGVNPWMYTGTAPTIVGKVKDRFNNVIATPALTYDGSPDPPTMPGSYTVVASFAGNANYEAGSATVTWTITKRVVDIQIFAQDVTYDGASHGAGYLIWGLHPETLFADSLTYNGSEDSPVNVGTYTVVVTYNGSNLYQAATATKTFSIHKATPTVTVTGGTFAYNGTPRPASGTVIGGGGISLGAPVLTYNGSPQPPVNGGTYNVVGTFAGDANHHPATGSATITINKVIPVVSVTGGTYTYDGQPHPATASATGVGGIQLPELVVTYNGSPDVPVNAGGYSVTATYPGNANYVEIVRHASVQINRAAATVTVTGGTFVYDGQPHPATVSVTGVGGVDLGPATVTYDGSSGPPVNAGSYVASAVFAGDANHEYDGGAATITITKAVPAIVVNGGTFTYDGQAHPATGSVTGVGGADLGPLTFTYGGSSEPPVNAGSYTALGSYAGSANYTSASRQASITIGKASATVVVNGGTFTYDMYAHPATGTVTGANGAALGVPSFTYNGSTSPPMNVGTYEVIGTFAGDANHNGSTGTATITIEKATPVLNWNRPAAIVYGTPLGGAQLNATAVNVGGVFTYSPAAGTVLNAGAGQTLTVTFTPFNTQNYVAASASTTIDVSKAAVTVTPIGGTFTYNGQPHPATGSVTGADGAALGTPAFTYNGGSEPPVNVGTYDVVATFAGTANYEAGSATTGISILPATAIVDWALPQAIVYGTPLGDAQLNATASVAGTFTYSPAAGTVLNAGTAQVLSATFTPADSNYSGGIVNTLIDVSKAIATVTATGGTFTYDGQPHPATGAVTGLNGVPLGTPSFTYNGSAQPPVNTGSYAVVASFAGNANYEPASAAATVTIGKATASLSWNQPAAIVYGTPLGAAQLNAASNVPGTFAYSPAAGVGLSAGSHQLAATFTPADAANYTGGSVSASISVGPAPLSIRANDVAKPFGALLPAFTASGAGFVNGDSFASLSGALAFATSATAQSAVGTYPVTPSGPSSPNYVITFVTGTLSIVRGAVTVAVSTSPAPSGLNQPMTFTASVGAAAPAAGTPGGTVRFFDGSTLLGSSTLSAGSTSFTTAGLAAGVHTIQATYDGDGSFLAGTGSASHAVNSAASTPSIAIASNRNPSSVGQSVTLTASLGMSAGPVSGTVQFYDGAALIGTSTIVSGSATFTTTGFAAGSHAITVRYLGSASAPPAISGVFVQAVGSNGWKNRTTSATVSASPNPSAPGAPVTLTADITGSSGTPAGAVLFMVNGEAVGGPVTLTAISGSTARATFALSGLPGGRHAVSATYLGNSNYKGSTASVTQTVN